MLQPLYIMQQAPNTNMTNGMSSGAMQFSIALVIVCLLLLLALWLPDLLKKE